MAVTLAALGGFGFAAVTALRGYLSAETDGNLRTVLSRYHQLLTYHPLIELGPSAVSLPVKPTEFAGQGAPGLAATERNLAVFYLPELPAIYSLELMTGGRTFLAGDSGLVPRLASGQAEAAAFRGPVTVVSRDGRQQLRILAESAHGNTLIAATSLQSLDSTISRLELIVAFGVLASALLVFAGVGLVVRRGLRPVEVMAAAADKITAGDLASRVGPSDPGTEVGRLGAALNGMLDRVEAAVREREASERATRQFFADASHELRTPLASLRANAELYQQGALPFRPQVDEAMRRISAEARRMGTLVEGMLRLARLDQHPRQHQEPVDVSALALECAERASIASSQHVWRAHIAPGLVATGDEEMLRRAIDNLLANVVTHTPAGTIATITASATAGVITLEVSDNGPGVPADHLSRIFDRFHRAPAWEHPTGSGLGLAIVTAIAAAHHGSVHSALNHPHGLRVVITLPAHRQAGGVRPLAGSSAGSHFAHPGQG